MERNGIDRKHHVSACLTSSMTFEGILLRLDLLAVVKVLHGHPALYRTKSIASTIGIAAYAARLVFQRGLTGLLWLSTFNAAANGHC